MSSSSKRLDLRFGAFACSVQGFDDPVQPVQQVLRAIQHLLEESPELSETAISFDAEAIEQLIGEVARRSELDESQVEIVPGLVIIHHGGGAGLAAEAALAEDAPQHEDPAAGGAYVNIFAPAADDAPSEGAEGDAESGAEDGEHFTDRLRRMASGGGDEYGWDEDPAEPAAASARPEGDEDEEPLNLFAAPEPAAREPAGEGPEPRRNLFSLARDEPEDDWRPASADQEGEAPAGDGEAYSAARLAERAGAQSVPELMVASAAWMVLIQGQTSFTRRDVLDVFETIPGEHASTPEARVKGFGKAVRNGQLVMTEDGIFGLARSEVERFQGLL